MSKHTSGRQRMFARGFGAMPVCACWQASASAAETPAPGGLPLGAERLLQLSLGLALVVLAIFLTAWVLRRVLRAHPAMHGRLRVLCGVSMGPRERVVLLQVGEKQLLLGVSPGRIQTLHVLDQPLQGFDDPVAPDFALRLRQAMRGKAPADA